MIEVFEGSSLHSQYGGSGQSVLNSLDDTGIFINKVC